MRIKPMHPKKFGQYFLHDKGYLQKIIDAVRIDKKDYFIEIGPGGGALTEYLIDKAQYVIAIEIDYQLHQALQNKFIHQKNLQLYQADALQFDMTTLFNHSVLSMRMIGNLAYNIATPLLFQVLKYRTEIKDFHFMLQKEVADRLVAKHGSKDYSRFSVMMQYYFHTKRLFNVPNGAFTPVPKVVSTMVSLIPKINTPLSRAQEVKFAIVVKHAFQQKRKMLSNTLKSLNISAKQLTALNINASSRPSELCMNDYVRIVQHYFTSN